MNLFIFKYLNSFAGQSALLNAFIVFLAEYLIFIMFAGVVALLLAVLHQRYRKYRYCNVRLFISAAFSAVLARFVVTEIIRYFYANPRPFEVVVGMVQLINHSAGRSFPSGHASLAFAVATAVHFCYPKLGKWFYAAAVFVSVARVVGGVHWPLDILGGAVVGIGSAYLVRYIMNIVQQPRKEVTRESVDHS